MPNFARFCAGAAVATAAGLFGATALLSNQPEAKAQDTVDMEAIFTCEDQDTMDLDRCNPARELFLNNCTSCHTFVQVVLRQYDRAGWSSLLNRHKERVRTLDDEEFELLEEYLAAKFNPDREPPELPPALLEAYTEY